MNEKIFKFYVPELKDQNSKFLYGYKNHETKKSTNSTMITVVTESNEPLNQKNLEFIGILTTEERLLKEGFCFLINEKRRVIKVLLNGNELPDDTSVYVFYYDKNRFQRTYDEFHHEKLNDAVSIAECLKRARHEEVGELKLDRFSRTSHNFLKYFAGKASRILKISSPLFKNTAIYRHCSNWKKCLSEDHSRNGFVLLDVMLGIMFFLIMNHSQASGHYFMNLTEIIVGKLRGLLEMLDGSPVGLKLNVQLNNFLLKCFMYHVDLWFNFIVIVEPAIHYLFVPITVFGFFGLSFQCALICDIITLITLHAHCFYIYAAMLYKLELSSIRSLLRIVLGRRLNVLKNRVESQQYTNRQLFLATLFFTTLLFIFPTVIIYYLVFASLRFFIYCTSYVLMMIQYKILTFPFYKYLRWATGSYIDATNISIKLISSTKEKNLTEFQLILNSSLPWRKNMFSVKRQSQLPKPMSLGIFALSLLKGELMAFLPNI